MIPPAEQQQVATALEDDAELMSNTQLEEVVAGQPEAIEDEIIRINTEARPFALQVALVIPLLGGADRADQLVPDDEAARPRVLRVRRGDGPGLTRARVDRTWCVIERWRSS